MTWENVSYNDPVVQRRIENLCGPAYGLWAAVLKGGVGSPRMALRNASDGLLTPFDREEDRLQANIEIRPAGLVIRCRNRLETLALPLPYPSLSEVELTVPGASPDGVLRIVGSAGIWLELLVRRDHWGALAALLRRDLPGHLFHTRAAAM